MHFAALASLRFSILVKVDSGVERFSTAALQSFLALSETLNFHRASERVYLSQPALSRQIRSLEAEVGEPLIDRSSRSIRLTPVGRLFEPLARSLLESLSTAEDLARAAAARPRAIRLVHCTEGSRQAVGLIARLRQVAPALDVVSRESTADELTSALHSGAATMTVGQRQEDPTGCLASRVCSTDSVVLVVDPAHPLYGRVVVDADNIDGLRLAALAAEHAPALRRILSSDERFRTAETIAPGAEGHYLASGIALLDLRSRWRESTRAPGIVLLAGVAPVVFWASFPHRIAFEHGLDTLFDQMDAS